MQKFLFLVCTIILTSAISAQQYTNNPYPKTISVTGSAELEIIPDQIYVQITLKEYHKKGESKKNLEDIKSAFLSLCRAEGIADSLISIAAYTGESDYFSMRRNRKKPDELFASVTYQIIFSNSRSMDALIDKLDDLATETFNIVSTNHSDMINIRKEVKTLAIKAAKEKANYLAAAINEKIGDAISINESSYTDQYNPYANYYSNNTIVTVPDSELADFKKMKIRHEIIVTFALR